MVRIIYISAIVFFLSFSFLQAKELKSLEKKYFNFLDLNNDDTISMDEINKSIKLIFQLIDTNHDKKISQEEIIELQKIIQILS